MATQTSITTIRNRFHSKVMAHLVGELYLWLRQQAPPCGDIVCGEAGIRLPRSDSTLGVDVAYVSPAVVLEQTDESTVIHGVPTLVAEIISPHDAQEHLYERIEVLQEAGVPLVWLVDPYFRTVTVFEDAQPPRLFSGEQQLTGGTTLPGFTIPVRLLFQ